MDNSLNSEIFEGKKFKDLFKEIYTNQKKKSTQILALIQELKPLASTDTGAATLIVPLIKEYLEIDVKNDEQLIKMAVIIQRCLAGTNNNEGEGGLSEEEKQQLRKAIEDLKDNTKTDDSSS